MIALDYSVFPDVDDIDDLPVTLETTEGRADFIARICGAWDFGIPPTSETLDLFASWQSTFDAFPIIDSPAYHAVRMIFGWAPIHGGVLQRAPYEYVDDRVCRSADPCVDQV